MPDQRQPLSVSQSALPAAQIFQAPRGNWEAIGMAWGYRHFGAAGLIVLLLIVSLYWQWNALAERPGMRWLGGRLRRLWPLPKAIPGKFTVMLAVFDNDPGGESRENIFSWLQKIDGVAVTRTARKIAADDAATGHRLARRWLRRCGADALIWGRILQDGGAARVPDLFWTAVSTDRRYKPGGERYAVIADDMRLPQMFWDDFLDVLCLHTAAQAAEVAARAGHYVAQTLAPRIEQMRNLLNAPAPHARWTPAALAPMRWIFAGALLRYGEQKGAAAAALMEAADAYRGVLTEWTWERTPLDWAMTQNNLGNVLCALGERAGDHALLTEAAAAYENALDAFRAAAAHYYVKIAEDNLQCVRQLLERTK